jgi:hypothetical protein
MVSVPKSPFIQKTSGQQCVYHKGKLWKIYGVPNSSAQGPQSLAIGVVNIRSRQREATIWLEDIMSENLSLNEYEPEGIAFWNDKLILAFPTHLRMIESVTDGKGTTAISGYQVIRDIDNLPELGETNIGYLVGTHLYVYVGNDGDTKGGKYQDCGEFKGPQGEKGEQGPQGPQGNSGYTGAANELLLVNDLISGGATAALSAEQGKMLNTKLFGMGIYVTTLAVTTGVTHSSTKDRIPCYIGNGEPFYAYIRMRDGADLTQVSIVPSNPSSWQTLGNQKKGNPTKWTAPYEVVEIGYYIEGSHIKSSGVIDIVIISNPLSTLL